MIEINSDTLTVKVDISMEYGEIGEVRGESRERWGISEHSAGKDNSFSPERETYPAPPNDLQPFPLFILTFAMARLSGLQRDVLSLYRKCLREIRNKPEVGSITASRVNLS